MHMASNDSSNTFQIRHKQLATHIIIGCIYLIWQLVIVKAIKLAHASATLVNSQLVFTITLAIAISDICIQFGYIMCDVTLSKMLQLRAKY